MKFSKVTIIGFGLLLVVAVLIAVNFSSSDSIDELTSLEPTGRTQRDGSARQRQQSSKKNSTARFRESADSEGVTAVDSSTVVAEREAAIEKMDEASTSYDPAELPIIQPYLESSDPELREAAIDAMINLGDASAGPMLREAAQKLDSDIEAKKMMDAADYVELPSANFKEMSKMFKKRREEKKRLREEEAEAGESQ